MAESAYDSYIICTTPRSGSTLLCGLLKSTGVAGLPDSHFHTPSVERWLESYGLNGADFATRNDTLRAIFTAAKSRGTGDTGLFGLRLQRGSFDFFMQQLALCHPTATTDAARISAEFGRTLFIHLTREDKLDQAISRVKATQTGLWHRAQDGTELERLSAPQEPQYDAGAIADHMAALTALDAAWESWFNAENLTPLRVTYDELSQDPNTGLKHVLAALGRDPSLADGIKPTVAKLADKTSKIWAKRFLSEQ